LPEKIPRNKAGNDIIMTNMEKTKNSFMKNIFRKRNIFIGVILLIVVAIITGGFGLAKPKSVESYTVSKGTVKEELIITGSVRADKYSVMSFGGSGKLSWVGVKEGQNVYKGQALAKLDAVLLNSAFETAKSNLRSADANVQYILDTVKDHSSDETFLQKTTRTTAEVAKDNAWEAYKIAEENLRNSTLSAPFSGLISSLTSTSVGVNVTYADQIVGVIDPNTIYFEVYADQTEIIKLKENEPVEVVLDSYPNNNIEGKVTYLALTPQAGETGSVYKVRIEFSVKPDVVTTRVGMTGDAKFLMNQKENVLYAPPNFIKADIKGSYVLVGNSKNKVYIETGIEGENVTEIIGNIKEGNILLD
jgi:membrane fusion protein (multidrug efflux system)